MLKNGHLSEADIAYCADAMNAGHYSELPSYIKTHMEICDTCAQEVMAVTEIVSGIESEMQEFSQDNTKQMPLSRQVLGVAAVGLLVIATGAALIVYLNNNSGAFENSNHIATDILITDTSKYKTHVELGENFTKKTNGNALIALFEPHGHLETLFENSRGAYRSNNITVYTPPVLNAVGNDVLAWSNTNSEILYIEIFNNKGEELVSQSLTSEEMPLPHFEKGLFYWKLINEEYDLLFVGKIIVN